MTANDVWPFRYVGTYKAEELEIVNPILLENLGQLDDPLKKREVNAPLAKRDASGSLIKGNEDNDVNHLNPKSETRSTKQNLNDKNFNDRNRRSLCSVIIKTVQSILVIRPSFFVFLS